MLRVITERQGNTYSLDLHGMLGGEWVSVLDRQWRSIVDHAPTAEVTVVLSNVDFIDAAGEQLLRQMANGGVHFTVSGCLNRYVVENLRPTGRAARAGR